MFPTTTPFPVTMPIWDPSTGTWVPIPYPCPFPIPTITITTTTTIPIPSLDQDLLLNLPSNFIFLPTNSIPTPSTGSSPSPSSVITAPAPSRPAVKSQSKDTYRCANCGTTESCKWRNAKSKENIRCNTCYLYRQKYNKERSAAIIENYKNIKSITYN